MRATAAALLVALAALTGCEAPASTPPPDEELVEPISDWRAAAGVEFFECGGLLYDGGRVCPDNHADLLACLLRDGPTCGAVHASITRVTPDGHARVDHLFRHAESDGSCVVAYFRDDRDDSGCPYFERSLCLSLAAGGEPCGSPVAEQCGAPDALPVGGCRDPD